MQDEKTDATASPAEDAGGEVLTDEQIWDSFEEEESPDGATPDPIEDIPDTDESADPPADAVEDQEPPEIPSEDAEDESAAPEAKGEEPEALKAQIEKLTHALSSERGRRSGDRRRIEELERELSRRPAKAREKEAPNDELTAKLTKAREEYPEVAGPIVDALEAQKRKDAEAEQAKAAEAEQRHSDQRQELSALIAEQNQIFLEHHPDGFEAVNAAGDAFRAWVQDQPKVIRDAFEENRTHIRNGTSAALVVSQFKQFQALQSRDDPPPQNGDSTVAETSTASAKRQRQLQGARTAGSSRGQKMTGGLPPPDADPEVHWDHFERVDRAKGR